MAATLALWPAPAGAVRRAMSHRAGTATNRAGHAAASRRVSAPIGRARVGPLARMADTRFAPLLMAIDWRSKRGS